MILFVDCEFNDFKGELISMALVAEDGREFYEVLECKNPSEWVKENVLPILNKSPVSFEVFQTNLQNFLCQFDDVHIIADWPEDIKHFCESLITDPGMMLNTPPLHMSVFRIRADSDLPHNALSDARGIARLYKDVNNVNL